VRDNRITAVGEGLEKEDEGHTIDVIFYYIGNKKIMKFKIILIFLSFFVVSSCVTAKDLYNYNYNNDSGMVDSMTREYEDPFKRPF